MATIKRINDFTCEACGGDLFTKTGNVIKCDYCGAEYEIEDEENVRYEHVGNAVRQVPAAVAEKKNSIFTKTWFIILTYLFIFPVGVILTWMNKEWSQKKKIIYTVVFGVLFLIGMLSTNT